MLSDSGVGRHQHVIVSQGQIDAVLNARAEERRSIIEEAAGVLKFRKRREKSERRLRSTEENITRLQDLLREVKRQLKPLERQADAGLDTGRRRGLLPVAARVERVQRDYPLEAGWRSGSIKRYCGRALGRDFGQLRHGRRW